MKQQSISIQVVAAIGVKSQMDIRETLIISSMVIDNRVTCRTHY